MNSRHTSARVVSVTILGAASVAAGLLLGGARADDSRVLSDLAMQKHCDECHAVDAVRIGPPFAAVAARNRAAGAAAVERLAQKIIHGGAGTWGNIPMIPNERVSLEEARALARWVLGLQPG